MIYIIDLIGTNSGMHYYNKSFRDTLLINYDEVNILSNYVDSENGGIALFRNYYKGSILRKIYNLLISILKYYGFILRHRSNYYIFLSYGNSYEIIFVLPLVFCKKVIIDIHEVVSLIKKSRIQNYLRFLYAKLTYKCLVDAVLLHSNRSVELLDKIGYKKMRLETPHFSFNLQKISDKDYISEEVKNVVINQKINILFFGYVRESKGADIVLNVAENIFANKNSSRFNLIIAGNDPEKIIYRILQSRGPEITPDLKLLLRYISDSELSYLFSMADYIFLPYKEISQSGVLEMAVHFRKPVITSSLLYFKDFLLRFPSFGFSTDSEDIEEYLKIFEIIAGFNRNGELNFYMPEDLKKFDDYKETKSFLKDLSVIFPANKQKSESTIS